MKAHPPDRPLDPDEAILYEEAAFMELRADHEEPRRRRVTEKGREPDPCSACGHDPCRCGGGAEEREAAA